MLELPVRMPYNAPCFLQQECCALANIYIAVCANATIYLRMDLVCTDYGPLAHIWRSSFWVMSWVPHRERHVHMSSWRFLSDNHAECFRVHHVNMSINSCNATLLWHRALWNSIQSNFKLQVADQLVATEGPLL